MQRDREYLLGTRYNIIIRIAATPKHIIYHKHTPRSEGLEQSKETACD